MIRDMSALNVFMIQGEIRKYSTIVKTANVLEPHYIIL